MSRPCRICGAPEQHKSFSGCKLGFEVINKMFEDTRTDLEQNLQIFRKYVKELEDGRR